MSKILKSLNFLIKRTFKFIFAWNFLILYFEYTSQYLQSLAKQMNIVGRFQETRVNVYKYSIAFFYSLELEESYLKVGLVKIGSIKHTFYLNKSKFRRAYNIDYLKIALII